jgi:hypothetical protein
MTLLASVASLFCTFSLSSAAPSVAVVPEGTVSRVEIISPSLESSTAFADELQLADDDAIVADAADQTPDATPDKLAAAGSADEFAVAGEVNDDEFLPADVVVDSETFLPADVVVDSDTFLPADVIVDAVDLLPADVVTDVDDSGIEAVSEANAEGIALAEAAADAGTFVDEQPEEDLAPTAPPSEEPGAKSDAGDSSGDGEAAS